jgi:hypothetical protein
MRRPLEDLLRIDLNLTPAIRDQSLNGSAVDALLESGPPNG